MRWIALPTRYAAAHKKCLQISILSYIVRCNIEINEGVELTMATTTKTAAAAKKATPAKKTAAKTAQKKTVTKKAAVKSAATSKGTIMTNAAEKAQDSVKKTAEAATERAKEMFGDINERAKTAVEKGTEVAREIGEFNKGNVEAMVTSARIAAEGTGEIAREAAEFGRQRFETMTGTIKQVAAVKSPTEFFQIQNDYAKSAFESMVQEGSKMSEAWLKLAGEVAEPISNRFAVAADKVKKAAA
ncbi:phasin family protein [Parasphingopyxis lamellibrachiae]|nr:phasin family protein [Parasphingopyxis lamellibrachiae]